MKRDAQGWRREAAALLAFSLPDGDRLAISGFGNPDRTLDLEPLRLDSSESGKQNRVRLAQLSRNLGVSDHLTDVYGALDHAFSKISSMSPQTRLVSPPVIVMLSDFKPEPPPDPQIRQKACSAFSSNRTTLLAVGFGEVYRKELDYLGGCANEPAWGPVADPRILFEIFWKLQHRLTRSLPIVEREITVGEREFPILFPKWVEDAFVLAWSDALEPEGPSWSWITPPSTGEYRGKNFRIAHLDPGSLTPRKQSGLRVRVSTRSPLHLSVVAAGHVGTAVEFIPPFPWIAGEHVRITARLEDADTGQPASEWAATRIGDVSALWLTGDQSVPLSFRAGSSDASFSGFWTAPSKPGQISGAVSVHLAGAQWLKPSEASVASEPIEIEGMKPLEPIVLRPWYVGQVFNLSAKSLLGDREFKIRVRVSEGVTPSPCLISFDKTRQVQNLSLTVGPSSAASFSALVRAVRQTVVQPPAPWRGKLEIDFVTGEGKLVPGASPIVLDYSPWPNWVYRGVPAGAFFLLVAGLIVVWRGPRLSESHFLLQCDGRGQPLARGRVENLWNFRGRVWVSSLGLGKGKILRGFFSRHLKVKLGPGTILLTSSSNYDPTAALTSGVHNLQAEDILATTDASGNIKAAWRLQ